MTQTLNLLMNGAAFGMLIFVLAAGLTMIFGLAGYLNLAHGSLYMLAAFSAVTLARAEWPFVVSVLTLTVGMAVLGAVAFFVLVHRRESVLGQPLAQVLVSFGLIYIAADVSLQVWGGLPLSAPTPSFLVGRVAIIGASITYYRLFVIACGLVILAALTLIERRTLFGAAIRAAVDDRAMLDALGRAPRPLFVAVFGLGFGLAGFAGAIGSPFLGAYLGVDFLVLLYAIPVVVLGGLGSVPGAFVTSLSIGIVDAFTKAWFPSVGVFVLYIVVVAVLSWRPSGLVVR